jgi:multisubunit Na+/H+ antiporter MnhE subunit
MLEALRIIAVVWLALAVTYAIITVGLIATHWVVSAIRRLKTKTQPHKHKRSPK